MKCENTISNSSIFYVIIEIGSEKKYTEYYLKENARSFLEKYFHEYPSFINDENCSFKTSLTPTLRNTPRDFRVEQVKDAPWRSDIFLIKPEDANARARSGRTIG